MKNAPHTFVINGRFFSKPRTGVTRVGREIFTALLDLAETDPPTFARVRLAAGDNADFRPLDREAVAKRLPIVAGPDTLAEEQSLAFRFRDDVFINLCNVTPVLARNAVTWMHDAHVFDSPESYSLAYRIWAKTILSASIQRRHRLVTVSHHAKSRLIEAGHVDPDLLDVIYNGGDHILREAADLTVLTQLGLEDRQFVVVMGSAAKHKNMPLCLRALANTLPVELKIVAVGLHQAGQYSGGEAIESSERIILAPRISDGQLRALYERCALVVVPSYLEGFGLPVAEALWAGAPLALANATSLPEIGGAAALYFDPHDAEDIGRAANAALVPETSQRLRTLGLAQRERFMWRQAASALVDRYIRA